MRLKNNKIKFFQIFLVIFLLTFTIGNALNLNDFNNNFFDIFKDIFGSSTITCNPCVVGNCQCSITSGCNTPAIFRVWKYNNLCQGIWDLEYQLQGNSITWNPDISGAYYVRIFDGTYCSPCTLVNVGSQTTTTQPGQTTTTQPSQTTTTQPSQTTTTTQPSQTTTTQQTTTTTQGSFTVSSFTCSSIRGGHKCKATYNNQIGEDVIFVFLYINNQAKVVSAPAPVLPQGFRSTSSNFYCNAFAPGNYLVSWRAYRRSDQTLVNPVAWTKSVDVQTIICKSSITTTTQPSQTTTTTQPGQTTTTQQITTTTIRQTTTTTTSTTSTTVPEGERMGCCTFTAEVKGCLGGFCDTRTPKQQVLKKKSECDSKQSIKSWALPLAEDEAKCVSDSVTIESFEVLSFSFDESRNNCDTCPSECLNDDCEPCTPVSECETGTCDRDPCYAETQSAPSSIFEKFLDLFR